MPDTSLSDPTLEATIRTQAHALATLLQATEIYQAFVQAYQAASNDEQVQRLTAQIREHHAAMQRNEGDFLAHSQAQEQLMDEMNALPVMQAYRQREAEVIHLLAEVDAVISQAAGVAFARNARRSSCACGH